MRYIKEYEYLALSDKILIFATLSNLESCHTIAPIVKWIERRFPKPLIRVRFSVGVLFFRKRRQSKLAKLKRNEMHTSRRLTNLC